MKLRFIFSAFIAHLVLGCGNKDSTNLQNSQDAQKTRPVVFVPIAPYDFVFERLAGDLIEINVIVGEGDDPHSYSPTPKQIVEMAKANLLCSGELGFESNYFVKLGDGKTGPKELNLLEGLELLEGQCDHPSHKTETTEDDHDHDHEDLNDPHVWLSSTMLITQSDRIASKLKEILPKEKASVIDANLKKFKEEFFCSKPKTILIYMTLTRLINIVNSIIGYFNHINFTLKTYLMSKNIIR